MSKAAPTPVLKPLRLRQQRFVHEYLVDGNAAAAARRAGYEVKRSKSYGCEMLKKPAVKAAVAAERARRAAPMSRESVMAALRQVAEANVLDYARTGPGGALELDLWRLERDRAGAVKELTVVEQTDPKSGAVTRTVGFKLADRSAALIKLLPMLEARDEAAGLARGRRDGIAAVAALTAEQFGRFREGLARAGR
ncbi:MAG: hypothetical protein JWR84_1984, partial [Caulobacter sp.]|nr:hypothetical protein [Caulobacter sp.]